MTEGLRARFVGAFRRGSAAVLAPAVLAVSGLVPTACADQGLEGPVGPEAPPPRPVAESPAGMVVTGSAYATEAGSRMLSLGGNAVDAAVAAAFALAVAEPTQSGLGGRTQLLVRRADGTVHGIDGTTSVPAVYDADTAPQGEHGHAAVGVPGTVAALTRALDAHGSLPLATVVEPALTWAREGLLLSAGEAGRLAQVAPELDADSEAARLFTAGQGQPLEAGALLVQPELATTLQALAEGGRDAYYQGAIGVAIAADMAAHGGFVTEADLASYRAVDSRVGRGRYRGYDVVGSWLPASGVTVIEILQILDRLPVPEEEARWAATLAEALLAGFEDREVAEHWQPDRAVAWITSDSLADRRAAEIGDRLGAMSLATAPSHFGPGAYDDGREAAFTTHISVADTFGNVVALTQSLGPTGGARVVTPGLGFLYASTLGGYLSGGGPGYRPWSSQAPLLLLRGDSPRWVMGGAGSRRILSALVATITRVVDQGMDLEQAMAAARLHPTGDAVLVQEGWAEAEALRALGYEVETRERAYFARLNVVEIGPGPSFLGVGDPRWTESAASGPRW